MSTISEQKELLCYGPAGVHNDWTEGKFPVRHAVLHAAHLVKGGEPTPVYAQTLRTLP